MLPIVYTPKGRAREYGELALNLFEGCCARCRYCYVPAWRHETREEWEATEVCERPDVLARLANDLEKIKGQGKRIFLCFTCDPAPPDLRLIGWTIAAVKMIHDSGNFVTVLTKQLHVGLIRALIPGDLYGASLTLHVSGDIEVWEPGTVDAGKRIFGLQVAHEAGIETFGSFEPVIDKGQTLDLIEMAAPYLTTAKVGKSNHLGGWNWPSEAWEERVRGIDWAGFAEEVHTRCTTLGLDYYLKDDLRKEERG